MAMFYTGQFLLKLFGGSSSRPTNQGWTLIEVGVVTVIVGILAAIAFPNLAGIQARNQLRSATNDVKAALQQAQKNAIKRGATCRVDITVSSGTVQSGTSTTGCVNNPVNLSSSYNGIGLVSSLTSIDFSYKGNPTFTPAPSPVVDQVIRLSSTGTSDVRCLVISEQLGIIRSGTYSGTTCTPGV
jgi:prepilin-type N-terminal cleavage/methylation domain-containing protein